MLRPVLEKDTGIPYCRQRQRIKQTEYTVWNKGFTLVELLLAMLFCAIGILGLFHLLVSLERIQEETTRTIDAAFCAQEKMEELKFMVKTATVPTPQGEEEIERSCGPLRRFWRVYSYAEIDGVKEIEVHCDYWWHGASKSVLLKSLVIP